MATIAEIRQAQSIVDRIGLGVSIRTDPRSVVGRLVNRALQRQIDLQQSLKEQLAAGLLEDKLKSKAIALEIVRSERQTQAFIKKQAEIKRQVAVKKQAEVKRKVEVKKRLLKGPLPRGVTEAQRKAFRRRPSPITGRTVIQQRKITIAKKRVFPQSKQTFIAAIDVGGGRMQDFKFISQGGKLIDSKPIGVSGPQSTRFKESGRIGKSAREIALSKVGVEEKIKEEITPTQRKIIEFKIKLKKIGDKFAKLVPAEGGIEGLFSKKKPPSEIVIERVPSEPSAQATPIITARGKTFFETLGINPNSQDSKNLKKKVERTQSLFAGGVLNQTQAKERNDKALKDFQSKEIVKGIPTAVALGAGFALLQAVPVVGQVAGVLLGAELVLRRKEIVKQFKEFPLETAGSFAAFAVGGFIGGKALNTVTNLESLEASGLTFVIEKKVGGRKTPLSETFPREIKFEISEKAVKTFAVATLKKSGVKFGKLSKGNQNFVTGQIKAFIRNNPAKLIPKARQVALKNVKASQLNKLVKQRLAGKFDKQIDFRKIRKRKDFRDLSRQDRIAIVTFSRSLRQRRIVKEIVKERKKLIKEREIRLDKTASVNKIIDQAVKIISEKKVVVPKGQIKPSGFVKKGEAFLVKEAPKVLKKEIIAHEKGHILFAKSRLHSKINKLSPKKRKQLLSISKGTLKELGVLKSLTNKKAKSVGLTKNQLIIEEFLVRRATPRIERAIETRKKERAKKGITFEIKKPPVTRFDTIKSGRQVLIQRQKQVQKQSQKLKELEIVSPEITAIQKLALKRSKQAGKGKSKTKLKQAKQTAQKVVQKVEQKQKQVQKQVQEQIQKQVQKAKQTIKQIQKVKSKMKQRAKQKLSLAQLSRQKSKLSQKLKQQQKLATAQSQKSKQLSKQVSLFKQSFSQVSGATAQLQKVRAKLKLKSKLKRVRVKPKFRVKKRRITKKKREPQQGFNVFARPIKKRKGQKRPKLIRVNKIPLTKTRAKDLRNFISDTSLARTSSIKPTKGKPEKPKLKVPRGFAKRTKKKFRTFRVTKGKRKSLPRGKVIERGKFLLDTRQEKRKITLKRRIAQLSKVPKRKPMKQITTKKKKTLSQAQLDALAKGRKKRLSNLRRKK